MSERQVNTRSITLTENQVWQNQFNCALFLNYDVNKPVKINNEIVLPPAVIIGGNTYPTYLEISYHQGEENSATSKYNIDFSDSTTANLVIIVNEYN